TAIGDAVNVSARLEELAGPGQILIGEATHALVEDMVVARKFSELELRGRSKPLIAYELVRLFKPA
ncbi:MAG: adenylate cyclase, partial [Candidatus Rokubacteria bacterium]|nr:adenylate cyclase [Candidatus Rokubacteria bacterium]